MKEDADANEQESGEEQRPPITEPVEEAETTLPSGIESLPPEAQGDANGGPLGCCLGITVGILLSLVIGIISRFYPDLFITVFGEHLSFATRTLMAVALIAGAIIFVILGWRIGKHFYREYDPSPRAVRKMAELERRQNEIERRRRKTRQGLVK